MLAASRLPLFSALPVADGKVKSCATRRLETLSEAAPKRKPFIEHLVSGKAGDSCFRDRAIVRYF
jgi:hypothetical protein